MRYFLFAVLLILVSCESLPFKSVTIGGGYEGVTGEVTLVVQEEKAATTEEKENLQFLFSEDQVKELWEKLKDKASDIGIMGVKSTPVKLDGKAAFRKIIDFVGEKK